MSAFTQAGGAAFSSDRMDWETPQDLFEELDARYHFTLDAAASDANAKCDRYYTSADDGLAQDWAGETVFLNPPYGRELPRWVAKAAGEALKPGTLVVLLVPARTHPLVPPVLVSACADHVHPGSSAFRDGWRGESERAVPVHDRGLGRQIMSVRIRRIDDHSDEGYIRVVLDTPAKAKAEIMCSAHSSIEDLDLSVLDLSGWGELAVDHLIDGLQRYLIANRKEQS